MADATYAPKTYRKDGGNTHVIASGGKLLVENGGFIHRNTTASAIATAGAGTYTAAHLQGGIIARDPAGGARTDTTATALLIIAGLGLDNDGDTAQCWVINTADAAEVITLAGGTDVTFSNVGQTIAQNESVLLLIRRASATAVTIYIVGA